MRGVGSTRSLTTNSGCCPFQPLIDALVDRIFVTLTTGGDVLKPDEAVHILTARMLASTPDYARAPEDERIGIEMSTVRDAGFLLGVAFGRSRSGGARARDRVRPIDQTAAV